MYSEMHGNIILKAIVGSTVHGTAVDDGLEDLDMIAVLVENFNNVVSFNPKDTWVERTKPEGVRSEAGDIDLTTYGLRKFLSLALKGNPTILLAFFVPSKFIIDINIKGVLLQQLYPAIVSKQIFNPFRGYMKQQHERLLGLRGQRNITRPELVDKYGYDTKYAGHIIRLGLQGEELLTTGKLTLPMPAAQRQLVVDVRQGKFSLAQISELIIHVERSIVEAYNKSTLPEKPDYNCVEKFMLIVYQTYWSDTWDRTKI